MVKRLALVRPGRQARAAAGPSRPRGRRWRRRWTRSRVVMRAQPGPDGRDAHRHAPHFCLLSYTHAGGVRGQPRAARGEDRVPGKGVERGARRDRREVPHSSSTGWAPTTRSRCPFVRGEGKWLHRRRREALPGLLRRDRDGGPGPLRAARGGGASRSRPARSSTSPPSSPPSPSWSWRRRWRGSSPATSPPSVSSPTAARRPSRRPSSPRACTPSARRSSRCATAITAAACSPCR